MVSEQIKPATKEAPSISLSRVGETPLFPQKSNTENQENYFLIGTWAVEPWSDPKVIITKYSQSGTEFPFAAHETPARSKVALSFTPDAAIAVYPEYIAIELEYINKPIIDILGKRTVGVALYIRTLQGNEYHEAQQQIIQTGRHTLIYPLHKNIWKTEHSNWQHQLSVPSSSQMQTMGVIIYSGTAGDHLRIAGLRSSSSKVTPEQH